MLNCKRVLIAALVAAMSFSMMACSLVKVDKEKDMEQIVAKVNGAEITKKQYQLAYESALMNMSMQYQMMGAQMPQDEETLKELRNQALEQLISEKILTQKADEMKIALTDEEKAEVQKQVDEDIKGYTDQFKEKATTDLGEGAKEEDIQKKMKELADAELLKMGISSESYFNDLSDMKRLEKLTEQVEKDAVVKEEDVKKYYDDKVKEQQDSITADVANFSNFMGQDDALVYPEGCFYVKHILIKISDEASTKITEIRAQQQTVADEMSKLIMEDKEANKAKIDELDLKNNEYKQQIDAAAATFKAKADEALAKAKAGEDFDKLIEQYGEDDGMKNEPTKSTGYLIPPKGGSYDPNFYAAALKLLKVGDISDVVMNDPNSGYSGYHIIKRVTDVPAHVVPYEEVKDKYKETVTSIKKNELFEEKKNEWTKAAKVERIESALKDNSANYDEDTKK